MAGDRYGLFGQPTPNETLNSIGRVRPEDISVASLGINAPVAVAMSQASLAKPVAGMLAKLGGFDQATNKARAIKSVMDSAESLKSDPKSYYSKLASGFKDIGEFNASMTSLDSMRKAIETETKTSLETRRVTIAEDNATTARAELGMKLGKIAQDLNKDERYADIYKSAGTPDEDPVGFYGNLSSKLAGAGMYDRAKDAAKLRFDYAKQNSDSETNAIKAAAMITKANTTYNNSIAAIEKKQISKDAIIRLQQERRVLASKLKINPNDTMLRKELKEVNSKIAKEHAIVGRTESDYKISANYKDKMRGNIDKLSSAQDAIKTMIESIKLDPSNAGFTGAIKRGVQTAVGIAGDLTSFFTGNGASVAKDLAGQAEGLVDESIASGDADLSMVKWANKNLYDPTIPEITVFENKLAYLVAWSRKGGGRLNTDDIARAATDTKVVGMFQAKDPIVRLNYILDELTRDKAKLQSRFEGRSVEGAQEDRNAIGPQSAAPVPGAAKQVVAKATDADGNLWYKYSDGTTVLAKKGTK